MQTSERSDEKSLSEPSGCGISVQHDVSSNLLSSHSDPSCLGGKPSSRTVRQRLKKKRPGLANGKQSPLHMSVIKKKRTDGLMIVHSLEEHFDDDLVFIDEDDQFQKAAVRFSEHTHSAQHNSSNDKDHAQDDDGDEDDDYDEEEEDDDDETSDDDHHALPQQQSQQPPHLTCQVPPTPLLTPPPSSLLSSSPSSQHKEPALEKMAHISQHQHDSSDEEDEESYHKSREYDSNALLDELLNDDAFGDCLDLGVARGRYRERFFIRCYDKNGALLKFKPLEDLAALQLEQGKITKNQYDTFMARTKVWKEEQEKEEKDSGRNRKRVRKDQYNIDKAKRVFKRK